MRNINFINGFIAKVAKGTFLLAIILAVSLNSVAQENNKDLNNNVIQVEGTNLARLNTAIDILNKIPGVSIENNIITVKGKDQTAVYINHRRVSGISELNHLNASYVKRITVITEPGSQYPSDIQAVILIERVPSSEEGFHLNEHLQLIYNNNLNVQNDLSLTHVSSKFHFNTLLSYNKIDTDYDYEQFFQRYVDNQHGGKLLSERDHYVLNQSIEVEQIIAKFEMLYDISPKHQLTARYEYLNRINSNIINNPSDIFYYRTTGNGAIDLNTPKQHIQLYVFDERPSIKHSASLGYMGKFDKWQLQAQFDFIDQHEDMHAYNHPYADNSNLLKDLYFTQSQSYYNIKATAGRPVGKGKLLLGIEHNDVGHKNNYDNHCKENDKIHASIEDRTTGLFASLDQQTEKINLSAGIRYDRRFRSYRPYEDDQTFQTLLDKFGLDVSDIKQNDNYFTGHLKASTTIGNVALSAAYNSTYTKPFKKHQLLNYSGNASADGEANRFVDLILDTEFQHSASITSSWKWLRFSMLYTHYVNPIFDMVDNLKTFNGPDYDALGLQLIIAPKWGFYQPNLYMYYHKQWIYMQTANGKNNLTKPKFTARFVNTFMLPQNFIFDITANWQTKGSERNVRNYSHIFKLDASIQKDFLNGKLSLMLTGNNILNTFCNDVTMYTEASEGTSSGQKRKMPRSILLSTRYKF